MQKLEINTNKNGFSVWLNGCWIIDGSTIIKNGEVTICSDKFTKSKKDERLKRLKFKLREDAK